MHSFIPEIDIVTLQETYTCSPATVNGIKGRPLWTSAKRGKGVCPNADWKGKPVKDLADVPKLVLFFIPVCLRTLCMGDV